MIVTSGKIGPQRLDVTVQDGQRAGGSGLVPRCVKHFHKPVMIRKNTLVFSGQESLWYLLDQSDGGSGCRMKSLQRCDAF